MHGLNLEPNAVREENKRSEGITNKKRKRVGISGVKIIQGEKRMLKINYEQGNSLDTSYFVAKESGTELRVKASDVIPVKYQKMITDNNAEVVTPEEAIAQMQKENSTIKEFDKFARKAR